VKIRNLICSTAILPLASFALASTAYAEAAEAQPSDPVSTDQPPASEQPSGQGEIIVTARRVKENLQTVPLAVTALSQEKLSSNGLFSPLDFNALAPGLRTANAIGDRSNVIFSIRGQSFAFGQTFPAVIPYFAEVPILQQFFTGSYFDLENVQVLRGPQGVRFGRVTDGGAVLLQPAKPKNEFGAYIQATVGNFGLNTLEGSINIPIVSDKALLRVSAQRARRNGFTLNVGSGKYLDDVNYDVWRVGLTLRPFEGVENYSVFQLNTAHENGGSSIFVYFRPSVYAGTANFAAITAELAAQQARGPRQTLNGSATFSPDYGIYSNRRQLFAANITTIDISDDIQLRNILGYTRTKDFKGWDNDTSGLPITDVVSQFLPRADNDHRSEELQLNGHSFNRMLAWTIGGYIDRQAPSGLFSQDLYRAPNMFTSFSRQYTKSRAAYGQAELDLSRAVTEGLKVSAGVRYTKDENTTFSSISRRSSLSDYFSPSYLHGICNPSQPCTTSQVSSKTTTYEFGASYKPSRNVFTYVTYRKGYRPGGINTLITSIDPTGRFEPEFVKSLELGVKLNGHLGEASYRLNIAAFHDKYVNIQKRINYIDPASGAPSTSLLNAADAVVKGIELESNLYIGNFDFALTSAYTKAKFDQGNVDVATLFNPVDGACNGEAPRNLGFCPFNRFQNTPEFQLSVTAGFTLPLNPAIGKIRLAVDAYHESSVAYTDNSLLHPGSVGNPHTIGNVNLSWTGVYGSNVDLTAFVSNVTNEVYLVGANSSAQRASSGVTGVTYGPPRMYGISARVRFGGS